MDRDRERELVRRIRSGDYELFERLIKEYQNPLYVFLLRIMRNEDDARDICQDTFFRAYKYLKSFREDAKFSSWLFQIGYHISIDKLRKKKRHAAALSRMDLKVKTPGKERDLEIKEEGIRITQLMEDLPHNHRAVLHLFYKEEKSYKEIASIMKIPINTVKSHIFRAKEILRKRLEGESEWGDQPT